MVAARRGWEGEGWAVVPSEDWWHRSLALIPLLVRKTHFPNLSSNLFEMSTSRSQATKT